MTVYGESAKDNVSKQNCLEFIGSALRGADKEVLKKLKLDEDVLSRDNLVFEVTPATADDAYGGWWISVYNENQLNATRATDAELRQISQPLAKIDTSSTFQPNDSKWTKKDLAESRRVAVYSVPRTTTVVKADSNTASFASSGYSSGEYSGGSVYVKGYTRKDGTYVRPHTRSRPSK